MIYEFECGTYDISYAIFIFANSIADAWDKILKVIDISPKIDLASSNICRRDDDGNICEVYIKDKVVSVGYPLSAFGANMIKNILTNP